MILGSWLQLLKGDPSAVTPWQAEDSEPKVDQEPSVAAQAVHGRIAELCEKTVCSPRPRFAVAKEKPTRSFHKHRVSKEKAKPRKTKANRLKEAMEAEEALQGSRKDLGMCYL